MRYHCRALSSAGQICNSREPDDRVPCEEIFRDVGFYEGAVPVRNWVETVKATGFDGW